MTRSEAEASPDPPKWAPQAPEASPDPPERGARSASDKPPGGSSRSEAEASPDPPGRVAPIWRRVLGQVIDQIVVLSPVAAIALAIGVRTVDDLTDRALAINAVMVSIAFAYEFGMIGRWGRTLGKFALGTRVVRVDTGGRVLWYSSAIRALVPLAAGVIPGIGQILSLFVYLRAFLDRRRRGWHDLAAGTIVVMNAPIVDTVR